MKQTHDEEGFTISEKLDGIRSTCPDKSNHTVEWPDALHLNNECYVIIPRRVAEEMWALCGHVMTVTDCGEVQTRFAGGSTTRKKVLLALFQAADAVHSMLDPIKHGE